MKATVKTRRLFFIADSKTGTIYSDVYEKKSSLLRDYDVWAWEEIVELSADDLATEEDKERFEEFWESRNRR